MTKDITGYGKKMGITAGLNDEGRAESVLTLQGERQVEGSISFRTMNTGNPEAAGGSGLAGDYAPTSGRTDGKTGNPRANNPLMAKNNSVYTHGYNCKLDRVVDGDTCDAMIDLGFSTWKKVRIRFFGVDTWESRTRDKAEKKKGLAAKAYVKDLLENSDDGKFTVISHGVGKYGRCLGELFVKGQEESVNELLKINGHAYEYHGEKKKVFKG